MHDARSFQRDNEPDPTSWDVTQLPLEQTLRSDDSALDNVVRRLLRDMSQPSENYAAHGTTP